MSLLAAAEKVLLRTPERLDEEVLRPTLAQRALGALGPAARILDAEEDDVHLAVVKLVERLRVHLDADLSGLSGRKLGHESQRSPKVVPGLQRDRAGFANC